MKLGRIIKKWRIMEEKSAKEIYEEIGLDKSTYWRLEEGENMDGKTLSAVIQWILK